MVRACIEVSLGVAVAKICADPDVLTILKAELFSVIQ